MKYEDFVSIGLAILITLIVMSSFIYISFLTNELIYGIFGVIIGSLSIPLIVKISMIRNEKNI